ncbi:hypothetical protein ACA910_001066 [Epithemia clementina (nom. ined.)]
MTSAKKQAAAGGAPFNNVTPTGPPSRNRLRLKNNKNNNRRSSLPFCSKVLVGGIIVGVLVLALALGSWFMLIFRLSSSPSSLLTAAATTTTMRSSIADTTGIFTTGSIAAASVTSTTSCTNDRVVIQDHTTRLTQRPCKPITVAYAVSLIKCGDFQSTPEGLVDAALVMHHSIYKTSSRVGASNYDYKMYAIVHQDAERCSHILKDAGFEVLIKQKPVEPSEIQGEYLRKTIHKEWCCGHDEFIKLYAYTLPEPIVVHVDMDFIFYKPMDNVFDAMLYHKDSDIAKLARQRIERERATDAWPDEPVAFMTRDWGQTIPGRIPGYQAGFIALRPNPKVMDDLVAIIKEGNYVDGFSRGNGWGGKGYGAFVGARAMQGLLAYYYDILAPNSWVELNQCRYNHMGMDVIANPGGPTTPNKVRGKCRNGKQECEDCMHTNLTTRIYSIHYTQCRKPWMCIGLGDSILKGKRKITREQKSLIPEGNVHLDHCLELLQVWHSVRTDLEQQLISKMQQQQQQQASSFNATTAALAALRNGQRGTFKPKEFQGHCSSNGKYLTLASGDKETLQLIPRLYI